MIVLGDEVAQWVVERTGGSYYAGSGQGIGWAKDGELIAGVLFDEYNGRSIHMHVAAIGKRWLTREYLHFCFRYPFTQLGVNKIIGTVDSTNAQALAFDRHLGFVNEAIIYDAGKQGDIIVLTMTRGQCRFLKD